MYYRLYSTYLKYYVYNFVDVLAHANFVQVALDAEKGDASHTAVHWLYVIAQTSFLENVIQTVRFLAGEKGTNV